MAPVLLWLGGGGIIGVLFGSCEGSLRRKPFIGFTLDPTSSSPIMEAGGETAMGKKDVETVIELYQSVQSTAKKQKRLRSSTFWKLFNVERRDPKTVARIAALLERHGLSAVVASGAPFGQEASDAYSGDDDQPFRADGDRRRPRRSTAEGGPGVFIMI